MVSNLMLRETLKTLGISTQDKKSMTQQLRQISARLELLSGTQTAREVVLSLWLLGFLTFLLSKMSEYICKKNIYKDSYVNKKNTALRERKEQ